MAEKFYIKEKKDKKVKNCYIDSNNKNTYKVKFLYFYPVL